MYKEINGNLISLALAGEFDVIAHGCNCFCTMGAGIAVAMKEHFECDKFPMEQPGLCTFQGDINKLGQIDWQVSSHNNLFRSKALFVVNAYTQYYYGTNHTDGASKPFDYEAFTLCMRKINHVFRNKHIGLPQIGAGLAGGDWEIIKQIIKQEFKDCDVTVVIYNK